MAAPRLERYEILGELGQGGMSVVYRARDKQLARDVALKVLHDFLARQEDARRRFHREAVAVAKLRDPGILEIYDYSGPEAQLSYIVTELIEGKTLREVVDATGAPRFPELGALVIAELARALRHAHEQGVVHRDIKPENVMITSSGQLKLMDFGIAQIMGGATKLTATGTLLGSPAHMAPEVIDGKVSDHRADIFSVGTILYWLCTGQLPFAAPNPSALFRLILEGRYPPPQEIAPRVGNGLAKVIEKCLEPNLELRYQDISELQGDLQRELDLVGLEPADSLVKKYLAKPVEFSDDLRPKLIERLAVAGKRALSEKNVGRAMDRFNRVLAIDPEHAEVLGLVAKVGRQKKLANLARRTAAGVATLGLVGGVGWGGIELYPLLAAKPEPRPIADVAPPPVKVEAPVKVEPPAKVEAPIPETRPIKKDPPQVRAITKVVKAEPPPPVEAPPPPPPVVVPKSKLQIRLGLTHANIKVDGQLKSEGSFRENVELLPGRHTIELVKAELGLTYQTTIEVDANGGLFEANGDGARRPLNGGQLLVKVPRTVAEAQNGEFKGWTSS